MNATFAIAQHFYIFTQIYFNKLCISYQRLIINISVCYLKKIIKFKDLFIIMLISFTFLCSQVTEIKLKYFDTVAVASALCVLKTGFLFVASEFGNQ